MAAKKKEPQSDPAMGVLSPQLIQPLADRVGLDLERTRTLLKDSVFRAGPREAAWTENEVAAALVLAGHYNLNPMTKEINFFRQGGKVSPYIGFDGWVSIVNRQEDFNGITFDVELSSDGKLEAVVCNIFRKGFDHPISVREYLTECRKPTNPWNQMPHRMLRQRAYCQAARLAYGIGIPDGDEAALETEPQPSAEVITLVPVEVEDAGDQPMHPVEATKVDIETGEVVQ